ncbi:MAG: hypothetical protein V1822_00375 [Candidatus Micrarchaeota archaeon]
MKRVGVFIAVFAIFILAGHLNAVQCSDGTESFGCSAKQPGYVCLPGGSAYTLQNVMADPCPLGDKECASYRSKCACENYPGYTLKDGACVKATCDYNGKTYNDGACVDGQKPKRCSVGQIVDDSNHCGCPEGKTPADNGQTCTLIPNSCRYGTKPCAANQVCKYVEENPKDEGQCELKQGCAPGIGTVKCTSLQYCDTSSDPNGKCITKDGCKYSNPACTGGKVCDQASNTCVDAAVSGVGTIDAPAASADTPLANAIPSNLSCCCAPAAGLAGLAGFAILRRKKK